MAVHKTRVHKTRAWLTLAHWHESEPLYRRPGTSRILLPGCGRELDDQPGRHPSAVFPVDASRVGPPADLGGVRPAGSRPASAAGRPPGPAPGPAASRDIARQRLSLRRGMPGGQAGLIPGAVRPDATVPSAPVPSRSSMSRVCIFGAADAPSRCLIWRASARRSGPRQRPAAPICQPLRARPDRRCRAAGRAPIRSLPVRAGEDLLVPPEMGASAQRAGRGRQPARSSGTVPPVPPATCPDGLCRCG